MDSTEALRVFEVTFTTNEYSKLVIRADTGAKAKEWVKAILSAKKAKKSMVRKNTITGNFMGAAVIDTLKAMAVIVVDKKSKEERLVTREMNTSKEVHFGPLPKEGGII
jgi:hypothetical protein